MAGLDALRQQIVDSYSTPEAVAYYTEQVLGGLRTWEKRVIVEAMPDAGAVLVVGCGAGREAFSLAALGYTVDAIDVSPPLLAAARANADLLGVDVAFHLTDGEHLHFDDGRFDAVTLWAQVIAHVPTAAGRRAFLRQVFRVMKPGGSLSLSAHDAVLTLAELPPHRLLGRDDPEPGDVLIFEEREAAARYLHFFGEDELAQLCGGVGFRVDRLVHTSDLGERWGNVFVLTATRP